MTVLKNKKALFSLIIALALVVGGAAYYDLMHLSKKPTVTPVSSINQSTAPNRQSTSTTVQPPVVNLPKPDYLIPAVANGQAPVISRLPTKEPVVFLGIDDGQNKQDFEVQLLAQNNIKASLFLANRFIKDNPDFFKPIVANGSLVEDHTVDHKLLTNLTYDQQKQEICDQATLEQQEFGRRPVIFRPPGGSYNADTTRAAAVCGMRAVVLWIAKANGGSMQYQIGHSLRPGDIVLMHFRPEFKSDLQAFVDAAKAAGLHTELLEDWLSPNSSTSPTT